MTPLSAFRVKHIKNFDLFDLKMLVIDTLPVPPIVGGGVASSWQGGGAGEGSVAWGRGGVRVIDRFSCA